jgi:alpha-glucosidase
VRQDPIFFRTNGQRLGRDGCRVPIPWEGGPPGFGFTTGTPWLPIPGHWESLTVEAQQDDEGSMLELYRSALTLRPRDEGFEWLESPPGSLAFGRGELVCVVNVGAEEAPLPLGELVLASEPDVGDVLPPDTAAWVRTS